MLSVETKSNNHSPTFRSGVPLHSLLMQPGSRAAVPSPVTPELLPGPEFLQHPEFRGDDGLGRKPKVRKERRGDRPGIICSA
jgi:hypothetical protein